MHLVKKKNESTFKGLKYIKMTKTHFWQMRALFLKHNLWVTPYSCDEMYLGGEFSNQNPRVGEGLATWVKQNGSLEEANIDLRLVIFYFINEISYIIYI